MVRVTLTALVALLGSTVLVYSVSCGSSGGGVGSPTSSPDTGAAPLANVEAGVSTDAGAPPQQEAQSPQQSNDDSCTKLDQASCESCCARNHAAGANVLTLSLANCLCGPPVGKQGVCQSQCENSDCSTAGDASAPSPGDSCDTCERENVLADGGGGCGPAVSSACGANQDCVGLFACWNKCASK